MEEREGGKEKRVERRKICGEEERGGVKAVNSRKERHRNKREGEIGERRGEGDERGIDSR